MNNISEKQFPAGKFHRNKQTQSHKKKRKKECEKNEKQASNFVL